MRPPARLAPPLACVIVSLAAIVLSCGGDSVDAPPLSDRLILVRAEGIVELSLATREERVLVPQQPDSFLQDPAVSPDGTRMAYSIGLAPPVIPGQDVDFGSDLYVAGIDGADPEIVLQHGAPNEHARWPSWYPDGTLLLSTQRLAGGSFALAVERLNIADGSRNSLLEGAFRPTVSPDGTMIAYVTQDPASFAEALWIAKADGSGARMVANTADGYASFEVPRFSPDGTTLAFGASQAVVARGPDDRRYASAAGARGNAAATNGLPMDIWTVDAKGGEPALLADLKLDSPSLAWSAGGERLFIFSGSGLFVIVLESGESHRIGEGTFHGQIAWLAAE